VLADRLKHIAFASRGRELSWSSAATYFTDKSDVAEYAGRPTVSQRVAAIGLRVAGSAAIEAIELMPRGECMTARPEIARVELDRALHCKWRVRATLKNSSGSPHRHCDGSRDEMTRLTLVASPVALS